MLTHKLASPLLHLLREEDLARSFHHPYPSMPCLCQSQRFTYHLRELSLFPMTYPAKLTLCSTFVKPDGSGDIQYYEVQIKNFTQQVYPDLEPTRLVGYNGVSPGPTFNMTFGTEALVRFINLREDPLAKATSVHLHGSISEYCFTSANPCLTDESIAHPPWDGWAEDITPVGFYKNYYYPNAQRARTLWYHDHAIDHTAENAYMGLAGVYELHDNDELESGLPQGKFDVPLVLNGKQYDATGQLVLPEEGVSMFGDVIHVNGQPWPFFEVEPRKYRFRVLDVAISRTFRIYLVTDLAITEDDTANHIPFFVVGSDSGRTSMPVSTPDLWASIAERWEIVIDFAPYAGTSLFLKNFFVTQADTPFENTNQVLRFDIGTVVTDNSNNGPLPATFAPLPLPPMAGKDLSNPDHIFTFEQK
jgi:bilirubin oxidase